MRWYLAFAGFFLLFLSGICALTSVVPESQADYMQRYGIVLLPLLAVAAFALAAIRFRQKETTKASTPPARHG